MQKKSSEGVFQKRCSWKLCKTHRKISEFWPIFLRKWTPTQVFSIDFSKLLRTQSFIEQLWLLILDVDAELLFVTNRQNCYIFCYKKSFARQIENTSAKYEKLFRRSRHYTTSDQILQNHLFHNCFPVILTHKLDTSLLSYIHFM